MKTYKQLLENLDEMFPGSKEYIAKYGKNPLSSRSEPEETGRRVHKGTYGTGEERPAVQDVEQAPKRGRGRPPGKYGSYKTNPENKGKYKGVHAARKSKLKEALEYMGALSESEIQDYVNSLDEQTFADLCGFIGLNESRGYDVDEYFGLVEDVEQLDELSHEKLTHIQNSARGAGRYTLAKKAGDRMSALGDDSAIGHKKLAPAAYRKKGEENKYAAPAKHQPTLKDVDYGLKRTLGARRESVEDVEQLDELSKSTLGSYIKKSSHDVATRAKEAMSDKIFNKSWKRREGMAKAVDRLTKEDFAVNESGSPIDVYSNFLTEHKGS